jgi:hypothetical protein
VSSTHLPRRAVLGAVLAVSIVGGGLAAFADDPAPGCPATYTDPAGDSGFGDPATAPVTGDDDLDIVAVTHSVDGGMFSSAVKVVALSASGPANSFADRFVTNFTVAKKAVVVTAERDFSGFGSTTASVTVGGTAATFPVKVVENDKANTLSAVMGAADLEKAVGAPLAGEAFSAMSASAKAFYPSNASPATLQSSWDTATAPSTATYAFGAGCGGAAAPAPAPAEPAPAAPPAAAPTGGGDPSTLPAADCFLAKDPKGDAHVLSPNAPNDPDLDLTGMTLGADGKNLYAYLKVDKLAAGPQFHDGHRFYVNFTFNKHNFTAAGSAYKNAQSAQFKDGLAGSGQVAHVTQLAVDGVSSATDPARVTGNGPGFVASGLKYVFDVKTSTVAAILPIADIEKYGKAPVAGAVLTGVYGGSYGDSYAVANPADAVPDGATTPATSKVTYTMGDNSCFAGSAASVASPLTSVGATKAQYGDTAAVAAKLVDAAGAPVAGKAVTFALGASKATGTTGADGVAKAALLVEEKAGKRSLVLTSDATTSSAPFTVLVEKTALKATGGKGAVTATLSDDDRHPVAGQVVTFTSGKKKVTGKTNAQGVAKATGLPAGNVKVTYAGAAGMYTAASTSTKA